MSQSPQYVSWHTHTHFSTLDGLNTPEEMVLAAKDMGMPAIAITDHGTLSGHRDLQIAASEHGIKPILGVEGYLSPTDRFDRRSTVKRSDGTNVYNHILMLATGPVGLKNLSLLSEKAWTEGYYHKPRIDRELLAEYSEGIIVTSACLSGVIPKAIMNEDLETAEKWLGWFKDTFDDNFYMEIQAHNPPELNHQLLEYADMYNIKPVVAVDCHYAKKEDGWLEEALLILSTKPKAGKESSYESTKHIKNLYDRLDALYPDRTMTFKDFNLYLRTREDLVSAFEKQGITRTDIFENSFDVMDKVGEYDFIEKADLLPKPSSVDPTKRLRQLVDAGLKERGMDKNPVAIERKNMELGVIEGKDFPVYFLIVANMIRWARKEGIRIGPGRGSAAGSLVCYALGITDVDPLEHNLLFSRFLDETREDWPDIDTDIADKDRDRVKRYLERTYKHVASIATYSYFSDKGVIKDAARVWQVPLGETNRICKLFEKFEQFEAMPETEEYRKKYPEVLNTAKKLRGRIRGGGLHAAGVVISKEPIQNYAPIESRTDPKGNKTTGRIPVVAYDMGTAESVGLIKLDVLGLQTLSVIDDTLALIKERHGKDIDLKAIDYNDHNVYDMLCNGFTKGAFQAEQSASTKLIRDMQVRDFNELIISNAMVRPGAANTVGKIYQDRKFGREIFNGLHPVYDSITEETYGVVVYQEQVMRICVELAGMSGQDANKVRRIIGKKKDVKEFEAYRERFIAGAEKEIPRAIAEHLWHDFEAHADYSFNKSHAVSYSTLTYWTAWLKYYYPIEFMTGLLKNEDNKDKITDYMIECKRLGITVLLPNVNKSEIEFSIEDDCIRFGLKNLKYISDNVGFKLVSERPFNSYAELEAAAVRKNSGINSRALSSLNAVGAATFFDNPKTGNEKYNLYEYLAIPRFNFFQYPDNVMNKVRPLDEYDDKGTFVVMAMVKGIKRGKGWALVDLIDETGSTGVFHNENTQIEAGQMYFILVADNRITRYVEVAEVQNQNKEDIFVSYLLEDDTWATPGYYYVIASEPRKIKNGKNAGKMMGTLILANHKKEMAKVTVWASNFPQIYTHAKPGETVELKIGRMDDGGLFVKELVK